MPEPAQHRTFHASCHCKTSTLSFTVPIASLPLPTHFCSCSTCRYAHGTLCTIHTPIPAPTIDFSTFTTYKTSANVERFFCTKCGAQMLDREQKASGEAWFVATSLVDAEEKVWDFWASIWLGKESTGDGGIGPWIRDVGGKEIGLWEGGRGDAGEDGRKGDWNPESAVVRQRGGEELETELLMKCHCGGIEMRVRRPGGEDGYPGTPSDLVPADKNKYLAILDTCDSCRLISGCAMVQWAFVPTANIRVPGEGGLIPYSPVFGSMTQYESSPGIKRTFCSTCGALATYVDENKRPECVDVAVGLMRAETGARAEQWLEWRERIAWVEELKWEGLRDGLGRGIGGYMKDKKAD